MKNQEDKDFLFNQAITIVQFKHDNGELQKLISAGLEVNRKDEYGYTLSERSVFGANNYDALFLFWGAGAKPETEYIENIFAEFKQGKKPVDLYRTEDEAKTVKHKHLIDYTKNFSAKILKIQKVYFEITEEDEPEIELSISLQPFIYNNDVIETHLQFTGFSSRKIKQKIYSETGYTFEPNEIESSSIYIQNTHNPVDLNKLKVTPIESGFKIEAELFFDFEYEGTNYMNETVNIETIIHKN